MAMILKKNHRHGIKNQLLTPKGQCDCFLSNILRYATLCLAIAFIFWKLKKALVI